MLANLVFWRLLLFYTHVLLLLQLSVLWLSIVTLNDAKPPPEWILRQFDVFRIRLRLGGLPHLETFTLSRLKGLPGLVDQATHLGRSPHLSCKRDQSKMRDYMDKRVTPPTWGPPPSCKQALICLNRFSTYMSAIFRAYLHGGGGTLQVGEVTRLRWGNLHVHIISYFNNWITFTW